MAIVSVTFTAAVFLTYLLLGVGIFWTIKVFAVNLGISLGLTYAMAALTFVLGGWSFFDAFRIARSGGTPKGTLGLPASVKQVIHRVIRTGLRTPSLVAGSFAVGFLVSILESLCTGQVYVPTILLMIRSTEYRLTAFLYLVLYNLMFILPLVVLTALTYWGVGSQRMGRLMSEHLGLAKVVMGVLFVGLGTILLLTA
jgi:cytochrome c biogenesis protein CcdA